MTPLAITPRQAELKSFVAEHHRVHGSGPSYDEMCAGLGNTTRGNVHRMVECLLVRGHFVRTARAARSLRVVQHSCPRCGHDLTAAAVHPDLENGASA